MPLFPRKSAFHGYFVVSNPHKRLCILHVVEQSCGARSFYIEHTLMQPRVMSFLDALGCLALLVDIDLYLRSKCMLSCRYIVSQLNYS